MRMFILAISVLLATGCAGKKYCEREQPYDGVRQDPPLQAPAGLSVPEPDPSYQVPEISANAQAAALGQDRPCLEIPPRLRSTTTTEVEAE